MSKLIKFATRAEFEAYVKANSGLDDLEAALASENNGVYGSIVLISDTGEIYANNKINIPGDAGDSTIPDLDDYALKTDLDVKVDKVEGMGLSTNDYTDVDKEKIDGLDSALAAKQDTISDLATIRSGAALGATSIQSHQDISGKQDIISDLDDIRAGAALGATASQTDEIAYPVVNHGTSDSTFALTPNVFHVWGTMSSLTITLDAEESGVMNEYLFQFTSGTTATTLSTPSTVVWVSEPSIEANKTYQVSIVNNIGIIASVDA